MDDMLPIFPEELVRQEMSTERWIGIPEPVREVYALWRPTPVLRAVRLERALQTPARIYYKYEGVSPAGSHKPNTAVAQAFYNKEAGIRKIAIASNGRLAFTRFDGTYVRADDNGSPAALIVPLGSILRIELRSKPEERVGFGFSIRPRA